MILFESFVLLVVQVMTTSASIYSQTRDEWMMKDKEIVIFDRNRYTQQQQLKKQQ